MESKKFRDIIGAYASIYEAKEEPEMEEGEEKEEEEYKGKKKEKKEKEKEEEGDEEEMEESADLFDRILEHLVAEGYADTNKAALAIMANMSEEWKQSILDEEAPKIIGLQPASPRMVKGYPLGSSKVHDPSKMKDKKVVRK